MRRARAQYFTSSRTAPASPPMACSRAGATASSSTIRTARVGSQEIPDSPRLGARCTGAGTRPEMLRLAPCTLACLEHVIYGTEDGVSYRKGGPSSTAADCKAPVEIAEKGVLGFGRSAGSFYENAEIQGRAHSARSARSPLPSPGRQHLHPCGRLMHPERTHSIQGKNRLPLASELK